MNQAPRPIFRQAAVVVTMLATAIVVGIAIGWLLSSDLPPQSAQLPRSSSTPSARPPAASLATATPPAGAASSPVATVTALTSAAPTSAPAPPATNTATTAPVNTPAPSTAPAPPATNTATAAPVNTPTITATQDTVTALLQQITVVESRLRSGELEALMDYGSGSRSSAQVRFDLGAADRPPRLDFKTIYQGTSSSQTIEEITIGERGWKRQDGQSWNAVPAHKGLWDQIRFFLPQTEYAVNPSFSRHSDQIELRWYDPAREADVMLVVDPVTAVPLVLERRTRGSDLVLTVTYKRWNTPVEILPPISGLH